MPECLICGTQNVNSQRIAHDTVYGCSRCGRWGMALLTSHTASIAD